jgi:hypothetical protein
MRALSRLFSWLPQLLLLALAASAPAARANGDTITFAAWIASYGLSGDAAAATADPDADGLPNLLEYALDGYIPTLSEGARPSLPGYGFARRAGADIGQWEWVAAPQRGTGLSGVYHAGIRWTPRPGVVGIRYEPELSHDLAFWYSGRSAFYLQSMPGGVVQAVSIAQNNSYAKYFSRLRVTVAEGAGALDGTTSGIPSQALDFAAPVAVPRVTADGSASTITIQDRTVLRTVGASTITDYRWDWTPRPTNYEPVALTRSSSAPAVIAPDPADPYLWRAAAPGTATLTLQTASSTYTAAVTVSTASGATTDVTTGFVPGSLRAHLIEQIDPLLAGRDPATALRIFTTQDHGAATYVRNGSVWAAPYAQQLTAISPWNSTGGATRAGVLISPRHVLFATHYQIGAGASIRFITIDGSVVTRTMTARQALTDTASYYPDFTVGVLDSDVPASISFARILPDDWAAKLPGLSTAGTGLLLPTLGLDQEEKALISDLVQIGTTAGASNVIHRRPPDAQRALFYEDKIGGDSGNPSFLIAQGQLVLTTTWTFGGGGQGTSVQAFRAAINSAMTTLGGGYQLTPADWSSFPSY